MKRIYLDNAASTPLDPEVLEYMMPFWRDYHGNPSSVHDHGRKLRAVIEKARKEIALLLGAAPSEIFFTSGGTEADNMAIKCTVEGLGLKHIVTSRLEHHAVLHPVEGFEKRGVHVTYLDVDADGRPDLDQLDRVLGAQPQTLVSLMHANNEIGTLLDLEAVAAICERHNAIFHSDTVQSVGNIPFDLSKTAVHFITGAAHKFYGPKGVGFLYVKSGLKVPSLICGGSQERNMRAGTEIVASIAGMAFALKKCYDNLSTKKEKLLGFKSYLREQIQTRFPDVRFNGCQDPDASIPTVLNVSFPGQGDAMILFNLDIGGVSVSGGSACTSGSVKGSHVLAGIGVPEDDASNSVRFSFGVQNTKEELDHVLEKLTSIVRVAAV